ncbi:unnamed protein product, partial [Timema podura]|nr:unnamed protein product [Timema podura]
MYDWIVVDEEIKIRITFEAMYDELGEHFGSILESRHTGVLVSVAQACHRLGAKQGSLQQHLMKALHCWEPPQQQLLFVPLLVRLVTMETFKQNKDSPLFVQLHGSLLLQSMLHFKKPIKVILINYFPLIERVHVYGVTHIGVSLILCRFL